MQGIIPPRGRQRNINRFPFRQIHDNYEKKAFEGPYHTHYISIE